MQGKIGKTQHKRENKIKHFLRVSYLRNACRHKHINPIRKKNIIVPPPPYRNRQAENISLLRASNLKPKSKLKPIRESYDS